MLLLLGSDEAVRETIGGLSGLLILMGKLALFGLNAEEIESDNTRYFPSLTEEMEYITTKNANNNVIKSAYETNQRSWFTCSSGFFLRAMEATESQVSQ